MFATVGKPIADSCLAGFHGTIFAYGQTGSGKTYTIQGSRLSIHLAKTYVWLGAQTEAGEDIPELKGLIPRMVEYVFSIIAKEERNVRIKVLDSTLGLTLFYRAQTSSIFVNAPIWKFTMKE